MFSFLSRVPSPMLGVLVGALALALVVLCIVVVTVLVSESAFRRIVGVIDAITRLTNKPNRRRKRK